MHRRGSVIGSVAGAARRASHALVDVMKVVTPASMDAVGVDVLGIDTHRDGSEKPFSPAAPAYEEDDLFEVDVMGQDGDFGPLIAGEGITSPVLDSSALDWAAELLLLTHEPMRRDMLEMQRALQPQYFGNLPDSWRVRAFFRFFTAWCSLISQQHAVEVAVHYDWLAAPTRRVDGEHRSELLSYHRAIELELLAISRLEKQIIDELREAADWTTGEPWSEAAQGLRDRLQALCGQVRMHLATQESLLPDLLRQHWGRISPPQLVTRTLQAAKRAEAHAKRSRDTPKLLQWVLHCARADQMPRWAICMHVQHSHAVASQHHATPWRHV